MSDLFRVASDRPMGPITGIIPDDGRWGGEVPEAYVEAIFDDVSEDIPDMVARGIEPEGLIPAVIIQTIMRTAQRLAVELDGCEVDLSTIFDDEDGEDSYGD